MVRDFCTNLVLLIYLHLLISLYVYMMTIYLLIFYPISMLRIDIHVYVRYSKYFVTIFRATFLVGSFMCPLIMVMCVCLYICIYIYLFIHFIYFYFLLFNYFLYINIYYLKICYSKYS